MQVTEIRPMSFEQGTAVFVAKARNALCWPIGASRTSIVNGAIVTVQGAPAFFEDSLWSTRLHDYAEGMIMNNLFSDPEGWSLVPSCLPPEVREIWGRLTTEGKRKAALGLVGGQSGLEVVGSLPVDGVLLRSDEPAAKVSPSAPAPSCPVCGLTVEGESDPVKAASALLTHQRLVHPSWQG